MKQQSNKVVTEPIKNVQLYTLEAGITSGPMSESFIKKNRMVVRTIQIRGDQTLEQLHKILFQAFDRKEEHMYEFQIGGQGPMDPKARRYGLSEEGDLSISDPKLDGDVSKTTINSLGLEIDDPFGYWFDFGDDWWHQINVVAIDDKIGNGNFPIIIKREGKSPPQYRR